MLRQTGHPAYEERRWIVTLPDGQPGGIPNSWAIPVENYTEGELPAEEERQTNEGAGGQRAGVTQPLRENNMMTKMACLNFIAQTQIKYLHLAPVDAAQRSQVFFPTEQLPKELVKVPKHPG